MRVTERELPRQFFFEKLQEHGCGALVLDYDGTLAPFRQNRGEAFPYPGVRHSLERIIAAKNTRVVLVSGRPVEEVKTLLGIVPAPEIWGVHGLQRLRPNGVCEMACVADADLEVFGKAKSWLGLHGLQHLAEIKPGSIAVHWRGIPHEEADRIDGKVRAAWVPLAARGRMSLLEFDGGLELRLDGRNKGHAVRTILDELEPHVPMAYLGDDATDEEAFCALTGSGALTVLVRSEWRETNAEMWIHPPDELLEFLNEWFQRTGEAP